MVNRFLSQRIKVEIFQKERDKMKKEELNEIKSRIETNVCIYLKYTYPFKIFINFYKNNIIIIYIIIQMFFCQYANIFGKPGQGLHQYRLFNIAIVDVLLTIFLGIILYELTG